MDLPEETLLHFFYQNTNIFLENAIDNGPSDLKKCTSKVICKMVGIFVRLQCMEKFCDWINSIITINWQFFACPKMLL